MPALDLVPGQLQGFSACYSGLVLGCRGLMVHVGLDEYNVWPRGQEKEKCGGGG